MDKMLDAEIWTILQTAQGNAVLLRPVGSDVSVPIFVGPQESKSIIIGLSGMTFPRPLTHDLLLSIIHRMEIELIRAEIYDIKDTVFLARLYFAGNRFTQDNPLILDSRPSDALALALALALRCNCPVFVSGKVVAEAGLPTDVFMTDPGGELVFPGEAGSKGEPEVLEKDRRRRALLAELEAAVANEEYERAAEIRDALSLLD
ncbi:MAG: bifunctional nuclease family protein [Spirochaetaceae bacterium]|jgi:bifunctional DNase/RNase|nr:bifunctional nuclease family protein [Spirochaetaceae bacterium]